MDKGEWRSVVLNDKQLYFISISAMLSVGGECCTLVLLPRDTEIVWSMGLLQRTSVILFVAAAGPPFSLKIAAYEQLNFFKVRSFSGEKNPPALPVLDEDLARLTALECKLCIYELFMNLCNWFCHTSVEVWRYYLQKTPTRGNHGTGEEESSRRGIPHFWEGEGRDFILCIQKLAEFTWCS